MYASAYDLKAFYYSPVGRVVRQVLQEKLASFWPDCHDFYILGTGYPVPYLEQFFGEKNRCFAHMPLWQGVHAWPEEKGNLTFLARETYLPLDNNSIDRVLMMHALEFSENVQGFLEEIWRVLRPNGRLIVIIPNRTALWAQADWCPFGKGRPYTAAQLYMTLMENRFVYERSEQALYFPPVRWPLILRASGFLEKYSRYVWPLGGVHVVEASKQIYARPNPPRGSKVAGKDFTGVKVPQPV